MADEITFKERYKKLNKAQKQAVDTVEGSVLVVAGPGSGKTEILSLRVANILRQTDIAPSNILCMTFTDSASINMRKRLSQIIDRDAYRVAIHTFHSFGTEVIDKNTEFFFSGANFIPADELAQLDIIETTLKEFDHDNPLRSQHPQQGFVYAKALVQAIGHLKKAGLTPDEFRAILDHNQKEYEYANPLLADVFDERLSKKSFDVVVKLIQKFESYKSELFPVNYFKPWMPQVAHSLKRALNESEELGKATPLSAWKTKYTKKDTDGKRVHKDSINLEKMHALSDVYEKYREEMFARGFYDFDDMLLETIQAIEKNDRLRYDLQEQFQYILVDEFQDTNDAQVRLLHAITNAEVNEGRPNIMAVGDDDQAIYKFQGAEISNILDFKGAYREPEIITMTQNYRSTQDILDVARKIIKKGEERLENILPEMEKKLVASNANINKGDIIHKTFETAAHEFSYIAGEVKRLIEEGKEPNDIAIISRTHKKLEESVAYLGGVDVPVNYERQQNVLEEPHVHQLIMLGQYVASLARKNTEDADNYLPEILSYPFWGLDRPVVWEIAYRAEHNGYPRTPWIKVMRESKDMRLQEIAGFFDKLGGIAQTETLETVFDTMVGSHLTLVAESEHDDLEAQLLDTTSSKLQANSYSSPFRDHYFSYDEFEKHRTEYLTFLSSLRVFVHALREYKNGEQLKLDDMVEFVDLHEKNSLQITDKSPFTNATNAVNLMTSHKAKGLEFDTVFVISCQDDVWAARSRGSKLSFPENLAIGPAGDSFDDQLKLFYVAMTRAKSNLYLTSYATKDNGKDSPALHFLEGVHDPMKEVGPPSLDTVEVLAQSWNSFHVPPFVKDEDALLRTLLEDYQMPVTHLNNFLDVSKGGPQVFLEQNLLRFPQSMTPAAAYGSSMHKAVELLYTSLRKDGFIPDRKSVLEWFEKELMMKRLSIADSKLFLKRGKDALTIYYNERLSTFDPAHKIEVNFKDQGVVIGEAHITGKIDKMINAGGGAYEVVDFKTGHAVEKWQGKTPYEKVKLHNYKRQLIFYKLLVENSRDFMQKGIVKTGKLEFLEPKNKKIIDLSLEIDDVDVERTKKLIEVVYQKIMNLDFPDVSEYSKDLKGVLEFEDSLV
ncbi:MAG: ATP-dependent helicase [Candidatus Pacebacteria bacterium]|nr:ATP-dependent helicase [Candidatus Paceibacterota bacterium]